MKKVYALLIAAISVLSSCGTAAKYTSSGDGQRFQDGIYDSSPGFMTKAAKADLQTGTDALVAKTKESEIYLFGDRKDTIMIPQNMSATIRYDKENGGTSVTLADNPYDWRNNIDPWGMYGAWDTGWLYRGPWTYPGYWGRYDPWYAGWYSPWHYAGWYDPWYSYGWYDPWYGGYWGWHDPYWHHHHYCGWYGGWGPHIPGGIVVVKENKWHGPRNRTGSDRVFTSSVSSRGGIGSTGRVGRAASVQGNRAGSSSASSGTAGRVSSGRVSAGKVSAAPSRNISRVTAVQTSRPAASVSTSAVRTVSSKVQQARPAQTSSPSANYRRPTAQSAASSHVSAAAGRTVYSRSTTSSGYDRSSSASGYQSYDRSSSSSSYNRSTSSGAGRSGYSGSSSSVSRGGSSGGYSRSSGSSGGRR